MAPFLREGNLNSVISGSYKADKPSQTFIYRSELVRDIMSMVQQVAPLKLPILISGEKGTGKKLLAHNIHNKSKRQGPVITLHCSSLSPKVFETELFGFSGDSAHSSKEGALQQANGGTLILDNITKMPLSVYERFKTFLKTGEIAQVGSDEKISLNTRIIYITNESEDERTNSEFHRHLYNCTKIINIHIPKLKDRKEDIPDLVHYFFRSFSNSLTGKKRKIEVTEQAMNSLKCYEWPENAVELKSVCEKLYVMAQNDLVDVKTLPRHILDTEKCSIKIVYDSTLTLADINRIYTLQALKHFPSKKGAAKALGITVKTLYNRLHEYGVPISKVK